MLFAQMLSIKDVWGCEFEKIKVLKGKESLLRVYAKIDCPFHVLISTVTYIHKHVEGVASLPPGASVMFSFWQGMNDQAKSHMGMLASACPTFRLLCIVQKGGGVSMATMARMLQEYNFPRMLCVKMFTVTASGSNEQFQAYICHKASNT
jgi:hypothetical protein